MPKGTVKWFNMEKGYGFIEPEDGGRDVFVHLTAVEQSGLDELTGGMKVRFEIVSDARSGMLKATDLSLD